MKVLSSLSNNSKTERCETVLKLKHRVIKLNLDLISDDSVSFSENSLDEPTTPPSNSVESPVKLDISKCFMMRKPSADHEESFEEPSRTSTPLPDNEEERRDTSISDSHPPEPRKVAKERKKSSPKTPASCHLCLKSFVNKIYFEKHLEQHKVGFNCKYCGRSFANMDKVIKHEKYVHVARSLHTCDQCSKGFRSLGSLRAHRALHSSATEKLYCKYCGKHYVLKKSYERHLKSFPHHDISNDLVTVK